MTNDIFKEYQLGDYTICYEATDVIIIEHVKDNCPAIMFTSENMVFNLGEIILTADKVLDIYLYDAKCKLNGNKVNLWLTKERG